jgi:hypothetical protein
VPPVVLRRSLYTISSTCLPPYYVVCPGASCHCVRRPRHLLHSPPFEIPPRRRAQPAHLGACPDCGLHRWHQPSTKGAWLCNNYGYWPERQAQAVPSRANEQQTERIVPSHTDELKSHFDAGLKGLVEDILRQLRPTHEQLLKVVEESRVEVATLAATVAEMRDTIQVSPGGQRRAAQRAC